MPRTIRCSNRCPARCACGAPRSCGRCFNEDADAAALTHALAGALGLAPALLKMRPVADRAWEREWLRDFHAMRFGERLWICPHHEQVTAPGAVIVALDPGLAFGTGTHASTALCLTWLDAPPASRGAGHRLWLRLRGAGDRRRAARRACSACLRHRSAGAARDRAERRRQRRRHGRCTCTRRPRRSRTACDLLLANILSGTLCALMPAFAALLRPGGEAVLAGILRARSAGRDSRLCPVL